MVQNRQSFVADFADLAAILSWMVGGALALAGYFLLHEPVSWVPVDNAAGAALAGVSKYAIPGLLVVGGLLFIMRTRQRSACRTEEVSKPGADAWTQWCLHEVETRVTEAFQREGHLVVERGGTKHPDCVDLEVFIGRDRYLVQCRRWKETAIDARAVRELYVAMCAERAVGGFIVASGKFTDEARKVALGRSIRIVPVSSLPSQINTRSASCGGNEALSPGFSRRRDAPAQPACPTCGKVMMPQTTRQDGSIVQVDWCCTRFPACEGSRHN